jgi:hypothetical protein
VGTSTANIFSRDKTTAGGICAPDWISCAPIIQLYDYRCWNKLGLELLERVSIRGVVFRDGGEIRIEVINVKTINCRDES